MRNNPVGNIYREVVGRIARSPLRREHKIP